MEFLVKRVSLGLNLSPLSTIISRFSDVLIEYPGGKQVRKRDFILLYIQFQRESLLSSQERCGSRGVASLGVRKLTDHRPSTHRKLDNRKQS